MNDTEWLDWRRKGIGGSDIGAILGLSSFGSAFTVWADKTGRLPSSEETQRQRIGKRFEKPLAEEFFDATGLYVAGEQTWCHMTSHPWRRCTVDGFVVEGPSAEDPSPVGVWECKTDGRHEMWLDADGVPPSIKAQCIWNAGITGNPGTWLTVMHAGFRIEHVWVPFDQDDFAFMCDAADRLWHDHILTDTPPEPDGSDATARAIGSIWPEQQEGTTADLTNLVDLITDRGELREEKDHAEKRLAEIDNRIKAAMGDAETGLVGGFPLFTYKAQAGRKTTCKECGHTEQGAPIRVLRTKTIKNQERAA